MEVNLVQVKLLSSTTSLFKRSLQTGSLRTCSRRYGSLKLFSTRTNDLRKWSLGFSFLETTTVESELFGKHALRASCASLPVQTIVFT